MFNLAARTQMPATFDPGWISQHWPIARCRSTGHQVRVARRSPGVPAALPRGRQLGDADLHQLRRSRADRVRPAEPCRASRAPRRWEYKASALDQDLTITTDGPPHIVRDHLTTMYIGRIDGVHNFDPWEQPSVADHSRTERVGARLASPGGSGTATARLAQLPREETGTLRSAEQSVALDRTSGSLLALDQTTTLVSVPEILLRERRRLDRPWRMTAG